MPLAVLSIAIALETLSFRTAILETNKVRGDASYKEFITRAKEPELSVILLVDLAALLGLIFALIAVSLSLITDNYYFDVAGTAMIGILLVVVAIILAIETKSYLVGEAATPEAQDNIAAALDNIPDVERIVHLKTLHVWPAELLVVARIAFTAGIAVEQVAAAISAAEASIRAVEPTAVEI